MTAAAPGPPPAQLDALRRRFTGDLVAGDSPGYDEARRVWNAAIDRRPALVARPASVADVQAAVHFARDHDLEIAVRGGGHSAAGFGTCDGGMVIDLGRLNRVSVDPARRLATTGGGALLGTLDVAAQEHGLVCPVGVVGHTGVAGLTLGGGVGRLQRRFGLTIDSLRAVELVTADGRVVRASAEEEPELFWGLRGAGANFGIATSLELDLHPFDGTLHRGVRMYHAADVREAWACFREFARTAPDEVSTIFAIGRAIPEESYPDVVAGRPIALISYNYCGPADDAGPAVAALRAGPPPAFESSSSPSYLDVQASNDLAFAWGSRSAILGGFVDDLPADLLDAYLGLVEDAPGDCNVTVTAMGGAIGRVTDDATAFTGRGHAFDLSPDAAWTDPALDEANAAWVRGAMRLAEPALRGGRYVNELFEAGPEITRASYGDEKLARLARLKRAWDPGNVFRLNHNIEPAGT